MLGLLPSPGWDAECSRLQFAEAAPSSAWGLPGNRSCRPPASTPTCSVCVWWALPLARFLNGKGALKRVWASSASIRRGRLWFLQRKGKGSEAKEPEKAKCPPCLAREFCRREAGQGLGAESNRSEEAWTGQARCCGWDPTKAWAMRRLTGVCV